jgi:hypothetical protein
MQLTCIFTRFAFYLFLACKMSTQLKIYAELPSHLAVQISLTQNLGTTVPVVLCVSAALCSKVLCSFF